jgi:hypothetical protein
MVVWVIFCNNLNVIFTLVGFSFHQTLLFILLGLVAFIGVDLFFLMLFLLRGGLDFQEIGKLIGYIGG